LLHDAATDIEFSRDERLAVRPRLDDIFKEAHDKKTRDRLIHQAVRLYEYTLKEVAAATGLHYSTISVIAKRVDLARRQK